MTDTIDRRRFLKSTLTTTALASLGTPVLLAADTVVPGQERPGLSPEEKKNLKQELQRELEQRVYSVDEELFRKVNRAADPGRYQGHETSHVPKIVAPSKVRRFETFTVKVVVGVEEIHEMQVFHYIDWIALNVGRLQIGFTSLTPIFCRPVVVFELSLEKSATLAALEHCNLHGTWESEQLRIEVE